MRLIVGAVLLALSTVALPAAARPPGPPPPLHEVLISQADSLGISADQVAAIEALAGASREDAHTAHEAMRAALSAGDDAAVDAARSDLDALRESMEAGLESILGAATWARVQAELPPPPDGPPPGPPRRDRD
jgi:hypothetical protein